MEAKIALIGDSNMWRLWQLWVDTYPQCITCVKIRFFGHRGANLGLQIKKKFYSAEIGKDLTIKKILLSRNRQRFDRKKILEGRNRLKI